MINCFMARKGRLVLVGRAKDTESIVLAKIGPGIFIRAAMIKSLIVRLPANYFGSNFDSRLIS